MVWVKQFIRKWDEIVHPLLQVVIRCYGEWQNIYNEMKDFTFIKGRLYKKSVNGKKEGDE